MALDFDTQAVAPAATESSKLKKHFGRFDILFFLICTIVGVDTIAAVAAAGGEAFTWMVIFAIIFFVPQALLFSELGTAFPQQGGPYLWTRMAFGHLVGAINNVLYWITNPVWLGGTLAGVAAYALREFFNGGKDFSTPVYYLITVPFIWVAVLAAVLSFRVGKWITTVGAFARFVLLGVFVITVIAYGVQNGVHGLGASSFLPTAGGFVGLIGVLLFNFVGFELPNSAGEEMKDSTADVPFAIARGAAFSFLLYAVPILGILLVIPADQVTSLGGFVDAIKSVFTVYGGSIASDGVPTLTGAGAVLGGVAGIVVVICVLTSGVTWIMGSDRALAVSGYDGAAPRSLGVINAKLGTPVRVNIFSGIVSTLVLVLATSITGGDAYKFFTAVLGVTISTTLISYLLIFPSLWKLRRSHPDTPRPYRMPAHRFLTILLMVTLAFAVVQLMAPGAGFNWFGKDFRPDGWKASEGDLYLLTELLPVLAFIVLGVVFWALGTKTRRENLAMEAELKKAKAELGPTFH
ncbi:amino acid/polyamine/organocation transporter (APC superfamily) [Frondihabitans sp. PhB188]|uniref:APC family permease n=1 Tax=Frondihabitans sp. PhB188 TaxID=2485200 RepID=UPI000F4623E1|nr:APC family permease [Frondihabitans sp. PhB188]ROQ39642.1 amino acid/polyamine/organocation transporter (APC superfamily) [Frondihabitans sp. PhB188]